jgi:hypothetical protein
MTWCRLLDGRLAWPDRGMAGTGQGGKLSYSVTDFRLQDGTLVCGIDELDGEKRLPVGEPREGEWWEMKDGCLSPTFDPEFLKKPHGVQG